jgi:hypothetical protein
LQNLSVIGFSGFTVIIASVRRFVVILRGLSAAFILFRVTVITRIR